MATTRFMPAPSYTAQTGYPTLFLQVSFQINFWAVVHCITLMLADGRPVNRPSVETVLFSLLHNKGVSFFEKSEEATGHSPDTWYRPAIELTVQLFPELRKEAS